LKLWEYFGDRKRKIDPTKAIRADEIL
jgi:hypothetical protein